MVEVVLVVEIVYDIYMLCVWCLYGEVYFLNFVFGGWVGVEQVVGLDQIGGYQFLQVFVVEG